MAKLLSAILERLTINEQIHRIRNFIQENELNSNKMIVSSLVNAEFNIKWAQRNIPVIRNLLATISD